MARRTSKSKAVSNRSVVRAVSILRAIAAGSGPLGLTEVARQVRLAPATVYRLLVTLQSLGMVDQDPETEKYALGLGLLTLGSVALGQRLLQGSIQSWMETLGREVGENVNFAVLDDGRVVYIRQVESTETLRPAIRVGQLLPAHCTGVGKVLLAYLPEEEVDAIIQRRGLAPNTPRSITSPQVLREHLAQVRRQGNAVDDEEGGLGVRCLAVPIRNQSQKVVAALSITGPSIRLTYPRLEEIKAAVTRVARMISLELGYVETGALAPGGGAVPGGEAGGQEAALRQ